LTIHADRDLFPDRSIAPAIIPSCTFRADSVEDFQAAATETRHREFYGRYGNPTHGHAEAIIARLEGAEAAILAGSGMAAISTCLLALCRPGDHLIVQRSHYGGITKLATDFLPAWGVEVTAVDQRDPANFAAARRVNTRVVVVESPSNPILAITDLAAVAAIARECGAVTVADNTFGTPINQRPIESGIDLVMHSATKYFGGHSDLLAGVLAGSRVLIDRIWDLSLTLGAQLSPFDSWLLARGLRTLSLRVERQNATALAVARMLASSDQVKVVHYPGLPSHPQHDLARRQMTGFGGVMSVELRGGVAAADRFIGNLRLFARAASLGGVESLAVRPSAMLATTLSEDRFHAAGVVPGLVRLSIGIENEADLLADLTQSLQRLANG
jgi:methionine-gamma-lyase